MNPTHFGSIPRYYIYRVTNSVVEQIDKVYEAAYDLIADTYLYDSAAGDRFVVTDAATGSVAAIYTVELSKRLV